MRTRNYNFKWWHGLLGLVGLGMVLGTVQAVARPKGQTVTTYRGLQIVVAEEPDGFYWSAQQTGSNTTTEVALGHSIRLDWALADARHAIDGYLQP